MDVKLLNQEVQTQEKYSLHKEVRLSNSSVETSVMGVERSGQQNMNLATGTQFFYTEIKTEHKKKYENNFLNRWARISSRAQDKDFVFNNLFTHFSVDSLMEAFTELDGTKAVGVDGISKSDYSQNLKENLLKLEKRLKNGSYKPKAKKVILIPKANGKTRPIAITSFEDKIVDWVVGKILTQVYEPLFIRNSFGYRPNQSATKAVRACYFSLFKDKRQNIVEIDLKNFFGTIPHRKMMKILGKRISDNKLKGLIGRFMKGGLINHDGERLASEIGTPQGSIMSPILANIYLHEVIDKWFIENYSSYNNVIVRYADDAVFFFKKENDAQEFLVELEKRISSYGLELNKEKTKTIKLTKDNHNSFNFLGFTFYWGRNENRKRKIFKIKTQKDRLIKAIREFDCWIKLNRNKHKLKTIWSLAKAKITGHINYYGFVMNNLKLNHFYYEAIKSLYRWLNRRSQKNSYKWESFKERLKYFPLMKSWDKIKLKELGGLYAKFQ